MEMKNPKLSFISILALIIAVSFGFYLGLSDDRTVAVDLKFSSVVTSAQYTGDMIGAWTLGANVLLPSRFGGMGYSYVKNETGWLYVMGGEMSGMYNITNRNERYNIRTNTWSVMAPMLVSLFYFGGARLKDSFYTVGGNVGSFFYATAGLRRYSINSNSWVQKASLPEVLGWPECVGYQDSLIYSLGGLINDGSMAGPQVYLYNALNNTWRTATQLPAARVGGACGIRGDTIVYVGGSTTYFNIPVFTVYKGLISQSNRANITWTTGTDKPGTTRWRFDFHDWGCKGLILDMGYSTGFGTSTEVYVYSPGLDTWTQMPNSLIPTSTSQSGSFALSGNVYKLVCASGLVMTPPYSIPQTQIFADTLCPSYPQSAKCRNGLNKPIPDYVLTYDTIQVALGSNCVVRDVNVRIDTVIHTYTSDMTFYLRKGSTGLKIINRAGGGGDNFIGTILDDSASLTINQGTPPFAGRYKPSPPAYLSAFNSQPTDGEWILTITDTAGGDTGILKAWCLEITYLCPVGGMKTVEIPNHYALKQNYPNPFNPSTTIEYALPKAGNVKLVVYDIMGREVATLVDEFKQAGIYNVQFDASGLSSGVYFYRIETKDFNQTKKMLIIK